MKRLVNVICDLVMIVCGIPSSLGAGQGRIDRLADRVTDRVLDRIEERRLEAMRKGRTYDLRSPADRAEFMASETQGPRIR